MRRRQVLALLGVLGIEGCLRLAEGGRTPTRIPSPARSPTATPTETPTDPLTPFDTESPSPSQTPSIVEQVDGLTVSGPTPDLADTHRRALDTVSYEARWHDENVTTGEVTRDRTWNVADGRALGRWTHEGDVAMYLAEEGYWREDLGSQVTYGHHRNGYDPHRLARTGMVRTLLRGGSWAPPELIESPPPGLFRIVAVGVDEDEPLNREFGGSSVASFAAEARVDGRGIVHRLVLDLETVVDGNRKEWHVDLQWDPTDVSVSAPSWLATARERAPQVSARITDDRGFVVLTHEGGNPMLPMTQVTVYDRDAGANFGIEPFDSPIEAGDTVYLWKRADEGVLTHSFGEPSNADPVTLSASRYDLWAFRTGGAEYFILSDI